MEPKNQNMKNCRGGARSARIMPIVQIIMIMAFIVIMCICMGIGNQTGDVKFQGTSPAIMKYETEATKSYSVHMILSEMDVIGEQLIGNKVKVVDTNNSLDIKVHNAISNDEIVADEEGNIEVPQGGIRLELGINDNEVGQIEIINVDASEGYVNTFKKATIEVNAENGDLIAYVKNITKETADGEVTTEGSQENIVKFMYENESGIVKIRENEDVKTYYVIANSQGLTNEQLENANWKLYDPTKSIKLEENGIVYTKSKYKEGNYGPISQTLVTNIDKISPEVEFIENVEEDTITISIKDGSATDKYGKSGLFGYAITKTEIEPLEFIVCDEDEGQENVILSDETIRTIISENGTYYIWVKDKAGNVAKEEFEITILDIEEKTTKVIVLSSPASELNGKEYISVNDLIDDLDAKDLKKTSDETIVQMVDDTVNDAIVIDDKNLVIDLNGYEISSKLQEPTINVVDGILQIVDERYDIGDYLDNKELEDKYPTNTNGVGTVSSENHIAVKVGKDTVVTIGDGSDVLAYVDVDAPVIVSEFTSIYNSEGILNIYDGKIIGDMAIDDTYNDTPILYNIVTRVDDTIDKEITTLERITGIEAVIGTTKFETIEEAIEAANNIIGTTDEPVEIYIVADITRDATIEVPENKNIVLNLNGFVLSNTSSNGSNYTIKNNGKLKIVDNDDNDGRIQGADLGAIYNESTGTLEVVDGIINGTGSNGKGIYNKGTLTLGENDANVISADIENPSVYGEEYGIYNEGTFNFYGGIVEGSVEVIEGDEGETTTNGKSIYGEISSIPDLHNVKKQVSENGEREIAVLKFGVVAYVRSTELYYDSISLAVEATSDNEEDKITLLQDVIIEETITINDQKNIILDLAGYEMTAETDIGSMIDNAGTLKVVDESEEKTGAMSNDKVENLKVINNTGSLDVTGITMNLHANAMYGVYSDITSGTLKVKDTVIDINKAAAIYGIYLVGESEDDKTVEITNVTINCNNGGNIKGIYSTVKNAEIIVTDPIITIGSNIGGSYGIDNAGSTFIINNPTIELLGSGCYGIYSKGVVTVSGGEIKVYSGYNYGITNYDTGTLKVEDTMIDISRASKPYGIYLFGESEDNKKVDITNVTINCDNGGNIKGIYSTAKNVEITVTDSTITMGSNAGGSYGIDNADSTFIINNSTIESLGSGCYGIYNKGVVTVNSGKIKATGSSNNGIVNYSTGILTIGEDDGTVLTTEGPEIIGLQFGVINSSGATFNFYDGTIQGSRTYTSSGDSIGPINGSVTSLPELYGVEIYEKGNPDGYDVPEGRDLAVLKFSAVAHVRSTDKYYSSLNSAIADTLDNEEDKITLLKSFTVEETGTISAEKNIILDLAGYEMRVNSVIGSMINNAGTLKVVDGSEGKTGAMSNERAGGIKIINNTGSLDVTGIKMNLRVGGMYGIYNDITSGTLKVKDTVIDFNGASSSYGVYVTGESEDNRTVEITNVTISMDFGGGNYGIFNTSTGDVTVSDSTITSNYEGIHNQNTGNVILNNVNITAETFGIYNGSTGAVTVEGGEISGKNFNGSIYDYGGGPVNVKNATITGTTGIQIEKTGTVTVENSIIDVTQSGIYGYGTGNITVIGGEIKGNTSSGTICNIGIGSINISDGKITGNYGICNNSSGDVTITNEVIEVTGRAIYNRNKGILTIVGGEINSGYEGIYGALKSVTGTTFNVKTENLHIYDDDTTIKDVTFNGGAIYNSGNYQNFTMDNVTVNDGGKLTSFANTSIINSDINIIYDESPYILNDITIEGTTFTSAGTAIASSRRKENHNKGFYN